MYNNNSRVASSVGSRPDYFPQLASGSYPTASQTNPRPLYAGEFQRIGNPSPGIVPGIHEMNKPPYHANSNPIQGTNYTPGNGSYTRALRPPNNVQPMYSQPRSMNPNVSRLTMTSGGPAGSMGYSQPSMTGPGPGTVQFSHNFQNASPFTMQRPMNNSYQFVGYPYDSQCIFIPMMPQYPVAPSTAAAPLVQKEKKVLEIINPETNANVLQELEEEKTIAKRSAAIPEEVPKDVNSGQSVIVPPVVSQIASNGNVAAEFSLQVARAIADKPEERAASVDSADEGDMPQDCDIISHSLSNDNVIEVIHTEEAVLGEVVEFKSSSSCDEPPPRMDTMSYKLPSLSHIEVSENVKLVTEMAAFQIDNIVNFDASNVTERPDESVVSGSEFVKTTGEGYGTNTVASNVCGEEVNQSEDDGRSNKHKRSRPREYQVEDGKRDSDNDPKHVNLIESGAVQAKTQEVIAINELECPVPNSEMPSASTENVDKSDDIEPFVDPIVVEIEAENDAAINQSGRKQYDRNFLLKFQTSEYSLKKPEGLPSSLKMLIKDTPNKPYVPRKYNNMFDSYSEALDFAPNYVKSITPKTSVTKNRSQPGRGRPGPKVMDIKLSINEKVELHEAENAWKPAKMTEMNENEKQSILKQVRGILNKLTPQNFDHLVEKLKIIASEHGDNFLRDIIELVFEKAVDEPKFSSSYAKMCHKLSEQLKEAKGSAAGFKVALLSKCQSEFEDENKGEDKPEQAALKLKKKMLLEETDVDKQKDLKIQIEEEERKLKRKSLGVIRFIGELFKQDMLKLKVMHQCVIQLLKSDDDEDSLECLCRLMTTMSSKFDTKSPEGYSDVNCYFESMKRISKKENISSRVRFMIQDVLDLRQNKWVPRREENNPKLKEEIKSEYQNELYQKSAEIIAANVSNYGNKRNSEDRRRKIGEWEKRPQAPRNPITMEKIANDFSLHNYKLHPQKNMSWSAGSSFNGRKPSEGPAIPGGLQLTTQNKFHVLNKSEEPPGRPYGKIPPKENKVRSSNSLGRDNKHVKSHPVEGSYDRFLGDHSKSRSKSSSRDNSVSREVVPPVDMVREQTILLMEEYWMLLIVDDAILCITEKITSDHTHLFVTEAINQSLERVTKDMTNTGRLFSALFKRKILNWPQFLRGFHAILSCLDELIIDIPMICQYIAEIIEPLYSESDVTLSSFVVLLKPSLQSPHAKVILAALLRKLVENKGVTTATEMWVNSGLQWSSFLDMKTQSDFIKAQKVEFTQSSGPPCPARDAPMETVMVKFVEKLTFGNADPRALILWLKDNMSEEQMHENSFIRALTVVCMEWAINYNEDVMELHDDKIKKMSEVLKTVATTMDLELQCLFAIQALVHKLNHPSGLLAKIFAALIDHEVLSEESIFAWENDSNPAEKVGKAVALSAVNHFLKELHSPQDESDSN